MAERVGRANKSRHLLRSIDDGKFIDDQPRTKLRAEAINDSAEDGGRPLQTEIMLLQLA